MNAMFYARVSATVLVVAACLSDATPPTPAPLQFAPPSQTVADGRRSLNRVFQYHERQLVPVMIAEKQYRVWNPV